MTTSTMRRSAATAKSSMFDAALAALKRAERRADSRPTPRARAAYGASIERLIATPAPDIGALAAKLAAADPFGLEHHAALLADARRLAGL